MPRGSNVTVNAEFTSNGKFRLSLAAARSDPLKSAKIIQTNRTKAKVLDDWYYSITILFVPQTTVTVAVELHSVAIVT